MKKDKTLWEWLGILLPFITGFLIASLFFVNLLRFIFTVGIAN